MADFPITINGNTWALADFEDGKYYVNLGEFIQDSLSYGSARNDTVVNYSLSIGAGSKTFAISSGVKDLAPGQRVILVPAESSSVSNFSSGFMAGRITAYDNGTGVISMTSEFFFGTGTYTVWHMSYSGLATLGSYPIPLVSGGTGETTAAAAYTALGFAKPATSGARFEDFIGTSAASGATARLDDPDSSGFKITVSGNGSVVTDGNVTAASVSTYAARALDGDHPGIAVLQVSVAGSAAEIALQDGYTSVLNNGGEFVCCFLIDSTVTESSYSRFKIGLRKKGYTLDSEGFYFGGPSNISENTFFKLYGDESYSTYAFEPGVWYQLRFFADTVSPNQFQLTLHQLAEPAPILIVDSGPLSGNAAAAGEEMTPFVRVEKKAGKLVDRLWVDYMYWNPTTSR